MTGIKTLVTLISQDPTWIQKPCDELDNNSIARPVKRTNQFIFLLENSENVRSGESLRQYLAIYQQEIKGDKSLRIKSLGDGVYPILIKIND